MKLKVLMLFTCILLATAPLFFGAYYLNDLTQQHYRELFKRHLESLSLIAKKRIEAAVSETENYTALTASRTQLRKSLKSWLTNNNPEDLQRIHTILFDAKQSLPNLVRLTVYDDKGWFVAADTQTPQANLTTMSSVNVSPIYLEPTEFGAVLSNVQMLYLEGEKLGYLKLDINASAITDLVHDRAGLGTTGEWLFAVRDVSGNALIAVPLRHDELAAFRRTVAKTELQVPIIQALQGNSTTLENAPDYRGVKVLAATQYLAALDWGLVVKVDEAEVNQLATKQQQFFYLAEGLILLLAIAVGLLLANLVAEPFQRLRLFGEKLRLGSMSQAPKLGGWQEIKEVSQNLVQMMEQMQTLNQNLQAEISERNEQLKVSQQKLLQQSPEDPITGLFNHKFFNRRLDEELDRAIRHSHRLTLVLVEVDHYTTIVGHWGEDVAHLVLQKVAIALRSGVRRSDICGRLSDGSFALLLPETKEQAAKAFLEPLREDIAQTIVATMKGGLHITCSFGIASFTVNTIRPSELFKFTQQALLNAKQQGYNRIMIYTPPNDVHSDS
ncbi:diguanylate cyclase domain-containing protein [Pseudoalteromonas fenneropenaei]|uniref:diguanylate cyclase n=1 Tax=Pseudoalteromonas fenneropenaei TaxID=1737459 RepID=A0ABV7CH69_9GAMM